MHEEGGVAPPAHVRIAYLSNVNADACVTVYKEVFPGNKCCGWFEQGAYKYDGD